MAVPSTTLPLGTAAPDFALPDPHGNLATRDAVRGEKGLLVVFACNHCPYVKHVASQLGELARRWAGDGIGVVAINCNDTDAYPDDAPPKMVDFGRTHSWEFPYLFDESQKVAREYSAACTPDFFLFDADLALAYRGQFDGTRPSRGVPATGESLSTAVEAVIAGEPVPGQQLPPMGCSIKWRPGNDPN